MFDRVDLGWQPEPLSEDWPRGYDSAFYHVRIEEAFHNKAVNGKAGRMLELACGEASHAMGFRDLGWEVFAIEPSPEMLRRAQATCGESIALIRAIGEYLPFKEGIFDRVLCQSSLDHYASPSEGMREMARVLNATGNAIIGIVNYDGVSCRGSRLVYKIKRRLGMVPAEKHLFWDDPTYGEHTFEGSIPAVRKFASPWFELEDAYGVSMLWGFPGWGSVLGFIPGTRGPVRFVRDSVLRTLDRVARRVPSASDFLILTWRRA